MCSLTPMHSCAHSLSTRSCATVCPHFCWSAALPIIAAQPFPFAGALPTLDSAPNWHSNPIAHRVRRKHQRLPPSLLIENASDRVPLRCESFLPEAFPIKPSDHPGAISSNRDAKRITSTEGAFFVKWITFELHVIHPESAGSFPDRGSQSNSDWRTRIRRWIRSANPADSLTCLTHAT